MTEYWLSNARKYCEFCKCWLADNKVSISFHENGKRHKENVQKHISQITKKSAKDFKKQGKLDDDLKKMETAAMAAYLKDVENNADLTSQSINEKLGRSTIQHCNEPIAAPIPTQVKAPPVWKEVRDAEKGSYFWNTESNETTWDPPDYYLSLAQQEKNKLKEVKAKKEKLRAEKQKQKEASEEANACAAREKMREVAVKKEKPVEVFNMHYGPAPRAAKPYGTWTSVVTQPVEKVDLQLPKKEVIPPPVVMLPERFQFGEKRVVSLGEGPVEFKKRKFNNANRNTRQKFDDE